MPSSWRSWPTSRTSRRASSRSSRRSTGPRDLLRERLADVGGARGPGFRIAYRPTKDRTGPDWQAVALAYRQMIEELDGAMAMGRNDETIRADLDRIEAELTQTKPGSRPLVVRRTKES